jgi:hypothetical protein
MTIAETMLSTLLKTIDIDKIIKAPQVQDALANLKEIRDDFRIMRDRLEYLEKRVILHEKGNSNGE